MVDVSGRIWLSKATKAEKVEPYCTLAMDDKCVKYATFGERRVLIGFAADGHFLGEVRFPRKIGSVGIVDEYAWSVMPNDDDEPVLTKFRIRK